MLLCARGTFVNRYYSASRALLFVLLLVAGGGLLAAQPTHAAPPSPIYLPLMANTQPPSVSIAQQVVQLTNERRAAHGCGPLTLHPQLTAAAQGHSQDMADHNYFSHTSLDGSSPWDRIRRAGYTYTSAAENIAAGYPTAAAVVDAWYNEVPPNDGHRRNILNCALTEIGIGYAENSASAYHVYWTQDFGTP
jgi:uncharacterized protein YkwD